MSAATRAALCTLPLRFRSISENRVIREAARPTECVLILSGVVCRYKVVAGGRRQILSFHFAGDLPDLQSLYLAAMDHTLASLTRARIAYIPHDALRALIQHEKGVSDVLHRHAIIDGSIFREWIANVGRRTAIQRIAHVLCESFTRMRVLGLATEGRFELPLTQTEIGDATGLSNVHVNRTMKELRRQGLIESNGRVHSILDWDQLQEIADFDAAYLHLIRREPQPGA